MKISAFLAALVLSPAFLFAEEPKSAVPAPIQVTFKVTGMSCESCAAKVTKQLATLPGVKVDRIDADDEVLATTLDLSKSSKAEVIAAVVAKGYKVEGEKIDLPIADMACAACAKSIKKTLASMDGVTVEAINLKDKKAQVTIDPAKTDRAKIAAALAATGFKVTS